MNERTGRIDAAPAFEPALYTSPGTALFLTCNYHITFRSIRPPSSVVVPVDCMPWFYSARIYRVSIALHRDAMCSVFRGGSWKEIGEFQYVASNIRMEWPAEIRSSADKLDLAEREGFEPSRHLVGTYTISSRTPSASRTPLRGVGPWRESANRPRGGLYIMDGAGLSVRRQDRALTFPLTFSMIPGTSERR